MQLWCSYTTDAASVPVINTCMWSHLIPAKEWQAFSVKCEQTISNRVSRIINYKHDYSVVTDVIILCLCFNATCVMKEWGMLTNGKQVAGRWLKDGGFHYTINLTAIAMSVYKILQQ